MVFKQLYESYYCTCRSGTRTLGSCGHVASVLLFLDARHFPNVRYPASSLMDRVLDAAHRPQEVDPNV
ncbi:unnamed protein product [Phaedon cochleariae]|uniref:SWIM-type domain-containing protein n=1 Tax=Phaedon cochleariae TaxID=80249 RepID=A0A9N9SHC5_PHACE|nr:unnamed protein product [Phaedon cochleariae]